MVSLALTSSKSFWRSLCHDAPRSIYALPSVIVKYFFCICVEQFCARPCSCTPLHLARGAEVRARTRSAHTLLRRLQTAWDATSRRAMANSCDPLPSPRIWADSSASFDSMKGACNGVAVCMLIFFSHVTMTMDVSVWAYAYRRIVMMGLHVCVNVIIVLTAGFYNIYGSGEALSIPSSRNFRQVGYSLVYRILYGRNVLFARRVSFI